MKNIFGLISIFIILVGCTNTPEKLSRSNNLENSVLSNTGIASFQNEEYFFISLLVDDLQKALEIWSISDSQGFPKLSTITKIKRNKPISLFLAYATGKNEIDMIYDFKILRPDGTFSKNFYKAKQLLTGIFDETDTFGTYQFHITIYNKNKSLVNLVLEFNLIE